MGGGGGGVERKKERKKQKRSGKCLNVSRGNTKQNVDIFNTCTRVSTQARTLSLSLSLSLSLPPSLSLSLSLPPSLCLSLSRSPAFVGFVAEAIVRMTVGQTQSCNTDQQNNQSGCRRIHQYTQQIITFFFTFFTIRVNRTGCIRAITNKKTRREGRKLVFNV